ncbi:hypothetical protein V8E55_002372 [Tylopilus felleus]
MGSFAQNLKDTIPEEGNPLVPTFSPSDGLFDLSKFAETDPTLSHGSSRRLLHIEEPTISNCDIGVHDGHECSEYFAQNLKDTIPKEDYPFISRCNGLLGFSNIADTDPILFGRPFERLGPMDDEPTTLDCDVGVHDSRDGLGYSSSDTEIVAAPHEGLDLMRKLLAELRDPDMDCTPRALSEDTDSEYLGDDEEEDEGSVPPLIPTRPLHIARRNSPELTSSPGTDSDVSGEGSICPWTPPLKPAVPLARVPDVPKDFTLSPVMVKFNEEGLVMSPTVSDSPLMFPYKAHVRSNRDSRSLLYGPRVPLVHLPRL